MSTPHTHGPDDAPAFLCRHCHPELSRPVDEVKRTNAAERDRARAADLLLAKQRELAAAERKLAASYKRIHDFGSVSSKIENSWVRKVARLKAELGVKA